jgi:hypothetical protein
MLTNKIPFDSDCISENIISTAFQISTEFADTKVLQGLIEKLSTAGNLNTVDAAECDHFR